MDLKSDLLKNQGLVLVATLILFLISNALLRDIPSLSFIPMLFAAAVAIEILYFVGIEVTSGAKNHGWKKELLDTFIALAIAVVIWYGASFLLNTSSPVSGVVSCSMLPNLQRGDFVLVQGAQVNAYSISMTDYELKSLTGPATIIYDNKTATINGSLYSYCRLFDSDFCKALVTDPSSVIEQKGAFAYHYSACDLSFSSGNSTSIPCVSAVQFRGKNYSTNFSNDIIVYSPPKGDLFYYVGDIIHRAFFKINNNGKIYYLTRGDNNPILDIQAYDYGTGLFNEPIPADHVRGKTLLRVPILGYFKLFISGYFQEDPQCKTQLQFSHIS